MRGEGRESRKKDESREAQGEGEAEQPETEQ